METRLALVSCLKDVPDPRRGNRTQYDLTEMLVVSICALLSGAEGVTEIAQWGRAKLAWLREFIALPHGVPSHDTFGRVLRLLDPGVFEQSFRAWVGQVVGTLDRTVVALDGKTLRGSRDGENRAVHLVSAYASAYGLTLGAVAVDGKSNEITALPELLKVLDVRGAIVSIDAMGCQQAVARQVHAQGGDYLLGLKANQGALLEDVEYFFRIARAEHWHGVPHGYHETLEKDHGRIETRRIWCVSALDWLPQRANWQGLHQIIMVESERCIGAKTSTELRYYLSSSADSPERLAQAIRSHWTIESQLHWSLDVTLAEDACRVRKDNAAMNLAILRRFVLNLLKLDPTPRLSVRAKLKQAAWDDDFRRDVLGMRHMS